MIDLIGFWTTVTALAFILVVPVLRILVHWIIVPVVSTGIPDKADRKKFVEWWWDGDDWVNLYYGKRLRLEESADTVFAWFIGTFLSVVAWASVGATADRENLSIVGSVSQIAEAFTPVMSWVGIIAAAAVGLRMFTRYTYFALKFKQKVEAHVSDKSIHN